jgi:tRNA (guanine-N1)-methyltransferase
LPWVAVRLLAMRFDLITIFPEFFGGPLDYGIVRRAREAKLIETHVHDLRDFTRDRHRTVDDRPFGGGEGMVMKPEPLFEAVESLLGVASEAGPPVGTSIVLLSAAGKLFRQEAARRFAKLERVVLICGRYEAVDERVAEHLATDEISVGDFVLSGGELPAAMILDAVTRLIPGALGNERGPRVTSHKPQITASSTIRITRAPHRFAAGMSPKSCSAATTKKSAAGGKRKRSKKLYGTARIYWRAPLGRFPSLDLKMEVHSLPVRSRETT